MGYWDGAGKTEIMGALELSELGAATEEGVAISIARDVLETALGYGKNISPIDQKTTGRW